MTRPAARFELKADQTVHGGQRLTDHLLTGILCLDADFRIVYLNPACENLLELSASRCIGQLITDVCTLAVDEQALASDLTRTLGSGQPYTRREALLRVGLRDKAVDYSVSLLPAITADEATILLLEIQPIDRLLRISREESQIQQHQVARQLVRSVAHEVKNPLGGIRGATQLLVRQLKKLEQSHLLQYTDIVLAEVDRLRSLADTMLGSHTPPRLDPVNIHEPLERVRALILSEHPQLRIDRDYDLSLPELTGDRDQLIQVILNICRNAVQAMTEQTSPGAPRLYLRTRVQRLYTIHGRMHRQVLRVDIEDNGPGIPTDFIESIFYPMVTGRAHVVGLGLAIAQDIIHRHEGLIECQSEPGQTLFSLILPWRDTAASPC